MPEMQLRQPGYKNVKKQGIRDMFIKTNKIKPAFNIT